MDYIDWVVFPSLISKLVRNQNNIYHFLVQLDTMW